MNTDTSFICPECHRVLRTATPVAAGNKIRCPACNTIFAPTVVDLPPASPIRPLESYAPAPPSRPPLDEQDKWAERPLAERPLRRLDAEADLDQDQWDRDRPRRLSRDVRRPRRSPLPLIVGGALMLVLTVGVVVGGFIWPGFFRAARVPDGQVPGPASDAVAALLRFMPADAMAIGGVDLSRLDKKKKLDELLAKLPQQLAALGPALPPGVGPILNDVEAAVAAQEHLNLGVVALKVKSPIKKEMLLGDLKALERDVQGKKIYRIPTPDGEVCALLDDGGKVLVLSQTSEEDFVRMLKEAKGPAGELRGLIDKISGAPVWGVVPIKGLVKQGFDMGLGQGAQFGGGVRNANDRRAMDIFRQTKAVLVWLDSAGGVGVHCGFAINNTGDAAWLRDEMNRTWNRSGKQQLKNVMQMQVAFGAPAHAALINNLADDVANTFRADANGSLVWMSAALSDNTTRQVAQLFEGQGLAGLANLGGPAFGAPPPALGPPMGKEVLRVQGTLQPNDPLDRLRNRPHKLHVFPMNAGRVYEINLTSDWDNYLRLEDAKSVPLAEDDDGGGFPNARIVFTPNRTENYRIIVTSFDGSTGAYTLTVHEQ